GLSFLAWLGFAAAIVVAVAVIASLTLVPALLGVMGHRVMTKAMREPLDSEHLEALDRTGWARLATAVTDRPWRFAIASTLILLVLAAPTLTMKLGYSDAGDLPQNTTARQANDLIAAGFGPGVAGPLAVVVEMYTPATAPASASSPSASTSATSSGDPRTKDPRLIGLRNALAATPGVVAAADPVVSTDGGVAIIKVTPQWEPSNPSTDELVQSLRADVIPPAVAGQGMAAYVGGVTALTADLMDLIAERTPMFILGVVSMSFVLLMIAYRSLLIPFKAAVMNLLSITAAYGVVTVIFQWGWGANLIGLNELVPIDSYVPMMMFAVLFGLSMDYEVFLLTAFREHWEQTGDMHVSVRRGLADTGRLVTAAALIMVVVFVSFLISDNALVKMFGVGLSTAVAVDATIVRCLLVPAIMVLAAKGTWWLPGWLDRLLPHLHVEGDPTAIDQIAGAPVSLRRSSRPLVVYRPAPVAGAALGVLLAWLLVSKLSIMPSDARTAVATAAVLAAIAVLLPAGFGGGRGTLGVRTVGYLLGVLLALAVTGLLSVVVPPVQADNGAVTSWAIVITALLAVIVVSRAIALPLALGAVSVAVGLGLMSASNPTSMVLLAVTVLPALITVAVTWMISTIVDRKNVGELALAEHRGAPSEGKPPGAESESKHRAKASDRKRRDGASDGKHRGGDDRTQLVYVDQFLGDSQPQPPGTPDDSSQEGG
ncbi:MAG: MMPL family transporter, partial [Actinomycetes bacterium]